MIPVNYYEEFRKNRARFSNSQEQINNKIDGVSVVTCTNKLTSFNKVLNNYNRQNWEKKELIIIINNDRMNVDKCKNKAQKYKNIKIFQLAEEKNLGECLNFAVEKSKYNYIAKFDDDDYYAPQYLKRLMSLFKETDADIVGKKAFFIYFKDKQFLILKFPKKEMKRATHLVGATLVIKKSVFEVVKFNNDIPVGSDSKFIKDCVNKGFKLYSGDRFDYVCIRNGNKKNHTWKTADESLIQNSINITRTDNYIDYIRSDFIK